MHENREISWTSWSKDQDRSAKVINRTADVHVQEKSDCAIVPMNRRTTRTCLPRRLGREGRGPRRNIVRSDTFPTEGGSSGVPRFARCGAIIFCRHYPR